MQNKPTHAHTYAGDVAIRPHPFAMVFFAVLMVFLSLFFLILIPWQTTWFNGVSFFSQPRFWPAVALIGWSLFSIGLLVKSLRTIGVDHRLYAPLSTCKNWLLPLEYIAYFFTYVFIVPRLGYLPTTILFCCFLVIRSGFRRRRDVATAAAFGIVVVVLFKSLLQAKIPGGTAYHYLPDALRNIMLVYF